MLEPTRLERSGVCSALGAEQTPAQADCILPVLICLESHPLISQAKWHILPALSGPAQCQRGVAGTAWCARRRSSPGTAAPASAPPPAAAEVYERASAQVKGFCRQIEAHPYTRPVINYKGALAQFSSAAELSHQRYVLLRQVKARLYTRSPAHFS